MKSFGDYMFGLLFAPLKRVKDATNQLYIFFKVIGNIFEECKQAIFKVREESMVISASVSLLPEHGKDRGLVQLAGETAESYRTRLAMKGIIAETAGTNTAIYYAARAFGYDNVTVTPMGGDRWAEATVTLIGGNVVFADQGQLLVELNKIKPASAKLQLQKEQRFSGTIYVGGKMIIGKILTIRQG